MAENTLEELLAAARRGDWDGYKALLETPGIDIAALNVLPSNRDYAVIHQLAFWGNVDCLELTLIRFPTFNLSLLTSKGQTPIQVAQIHKHTPFINFVQKRLEGPVDPNAQPELPFEEEPVSDQDTSDLPPPSSNSPSSTPRAIVAATTGLAIVAVAGRLLSRRNPTTGDGVKGRPNPAAVLALSVVTAIGAVSFWHHFLRKRPESEEPEHKEEEVKGPIKWGWGWLRSDKARRDWTTLAGRLHDDSSGALVNPVYLSNLLRTQPDLNAFVALKIGTEIVSTSALGTKDIPEKLDAHLDGLVGKPAHTKALLLALRTNNETFREMCEDMGKSRVRFWITAVPARVAFYEECGFQKDTTASQGLVKMVCEVTVK